MIYLAVFNVCPPHSYETTWVEGRVGRRGQSRGWGVELGGQQGTVEWGAALDEDFLNGSVQSFRRTRIFSPKIHACVKRRQQ